jgi:hypothetical protein
MFDQNDNVLDQKISCANCARCANCAPWKPEMVQIAQLAHELLIKMTMSSIKTFHVQIAHVAKMQLTQKCKRAACSPSNKDPSPWQKPGSRP